MTAITTTLTWRDRTERRPEFNLYAGLLRIGEVTKYLGARMAEKPWEARFFGNGIAGSGDFYTTESEARSALEQAAVSALTRNV